MIKAQNIPSILLPPKAPQVNAENSRHNSIKKVIPLIQKGVSLKPTK
jgi:hypothetical protein